MAASMCTRVDKLHTVIRVIKPLRLTYCTVAQPLGSEHEVDLYPPVQGKFPPGQWGAMDKIDAWYFQKHRDEVSQLTTVKNRIDYLTARNTNMWRYIALDSYPRLLRYQQYATKTHLAEGLPKLYDDVNVDELVEKIKPMIIDRIRIEKELFLREKSLSKVASWNQENYHQNIILKAVIDALLMFCSENCEHLRRSHLLENSRVHASWDRHGFDYKKRLPISFPAMQKITLAGQEQKCWHKIVNFSKLQCYYNPTFLLKTEEPLPEFLAREDNLCTSGTYPHKEYKPTVYGQILHTSTKPSYIAGTWQGDPCEFTHLTVQAAHRAYQLIKQYGRPTKMDTLLGLGMNASFVNTIADAHYQGFNTYCELTYPLTTQTVLSDGMNFTFFAYQLNTLELWLDDEANPLRNICWHTGEMKLYETLEAGEMKGFNDDVLKTLVKFFVIKTGRPSLSFQPSNIEIDPETELFQTVEEDTLR